MKQTSILFWIGCLTALIALASASTTLKPVPYRDVKSIVLDAGKQTLGRRSTVPQMAYVGGDSRYASVLPTTMQCRNEGWSGDQFTWACQTQLPNGVDLDRVEVVCEDWDPPVNDAAESDIMTVGSCGVEYTLRGTPPSATPPPPVVQHVIQSPVGVPHVVYHAPAPAPPTAYYKETPPLTDQQLRIWIGIFGTLMILLFVIVCCIACDSSGSSRRSSPPPTIVVEPAPVVVETEDGTTTYTRPLRRSQRHVVVEQEAPVYVAPAPTPVYVAPAPAPVYVAPAPAPATVVIDNRRSTSAARSEGFIDGMVTNALWNMATTPSRSSSSSSWGGGGGSSVTTNIFHSAPSPSLSSSSSSTHSSSAFGGTKRR